MKDIYIVMCNDKDSEYEDENFIVDMFFTKQDAYDKRDECESEYGDNQNFWVDRWVVND